MQSPSERVTERGKPVGDRRECAGMGHPCARSRALEAPDALGRNRRPRSVTRYEETDADLASEDAWRQRNEGESGG